MQICWSLSIPHCIQPCSFHVLSTILYPLPLTTDNCASWAHYRSSIPMIISLSLCGVSFCGADVGGFISDPLPELFLRWVQLGAFFPFFRIHSAKETKPRELFKQDPELIPLFRDAVRRRYLSITFGCLAFTICSPLYRVTRCCCLLCFPAVGILF